MPRRTHDDSLETKKNILASAQRLFTRRGFERTSLSDIAKYLGVTRGLSIGILKTRKSYCYV